MGVAEAGASTMATASDAGRKNMAMDVMMMLEGEALTQVYTVFKEKNDREDGSGLSQTEFVSAVLKYLPRRYLQTLDKVDLVMQLSELFAQVWCCLLCGWAPSGVAVHQPSCLDTLVGSCSRPATAVQSCVCAPLFAPPPSPQIDVNGDGELEWSEFTQFCVEAGVTTRSVPTADFSYKFDASYHDMVAHRGVIQAMLYEESTKEMIVVEGGSSEVKLFKSGGLWGLWRALFGGLGPWTMGRGRALHDPVVAGVACSVPPPLHPHPLTHPCAPWPDLHSYRTLRTEENSTKLAKDAGAASCVSVEVCRSRRALAVSQSNHVISVWAMDTFAFIGALPCHSNPQVMCW